MTKELNTSTISAAAKKTPCLLHFGALPGNLFHRVGAALRNDLAPECFLFGFSPNPEMASLHWKEERDERGGVYGETSFCRYCGVVLCMHWYV